MSTYHDNGYNFDEFQAKLPESLKGAFLADEHADAHPYIAGTEIVRQGNRMYEDFYDPFFQNWGFINHSTHSNVKWEWVRDHTGTASRLQLKAHAHIRRGDEVLWNYGDTYAGLPAATAKKPAHVRNPHVQWEFPHKKQKLPPLVFRTGY